MNKTDTDDAMSIAEICDALQRDLSAAQARIKELEEALRRAVLALAFAAESSPAMQDDYNAVSAALKK